MSKVQSTPQAPPTTSPPTEPAERGGAGPILVFLLGFVAWFVALGMINTADEQDAPATNYALGIGFTIVGATFILAAAIYDATRRSR